MEPPVQRPSDAAGRRAQAERDVLRELVAIFAHDLSNPLQSLSVLCELALEEATLHSDEHLRATQCLEAVERMRALVHGLAGVTRHLDGPRHADGITRRLGSLLGRRFDRNNVDVEIEVGAIADAVPSHVLELALVDLVLAAMDAVENARRPRCVLTLKGSRPSPTLEPSRCRFDLTLHGVDRDGSLQPLSLPAEHCERIRRLLAEDPAITFEHEDNVGRLKFVALET